MIVMKQIKAARRSIEPYRRQFRNACKRAGYGIKKDFEKTTATWEHKPEFKVSTSVVGPGPAVEVTTDDDIYRFVNDGTKPHPIFAGIFTGKSKKKALVFQWGGPGTYTAKTVPGVIGSRGGGPSGDIVKRAYVQHPGTEARRFDQDIEEMWRPKFKAEIEQALRDAVREAGMAAK